MRKVLTLLLVSAALAAAAPTTASATSQGRHDRYYTVMCLTDTGDTVAAESVDARAIERGGKLGAIANFSANFPLGWSCWAEGPFSN